MSGAEGGGVSNGLFVDEGVYTKNRNFRLYLSSKFGKETALRAKDSSTFTSDSHRAIFFDTLGNCLTITSPNTRATPDWSLVSHKNRYTLYLFISSFFIFALMLLYFFDLFTKGNAWKQKGSTEKPSLKVVPKGDTKVPVVSTAIYCMYCHLITPV